jgi:predicted hydrocarbon binding protein
MHCHCHKGTHKAIFEAALGRPFQVEIMESVRRGGEQCYFRINLA